MNKILTVFLSFILSVSTLAQESIVKLLPDISNLPGLQTAGDPKIFTGEDLFEMINGGAEIYLEYGFVQTVSQNYSDLTGRANLKIEIYEMTDPEAAYGIFAFSTMGQEILDRSGFYIARGLGYGMMVRGSYFIIATYVNLPEELNGKVLRRIAEDFNSKVETYAELPKLYVSTQPPCRDFTRSLYIRGPLALRNVSYMSFKIPFDFSEGMFYRCDVYDYLLLLPKSDKSKKELVQETISNIIKKNPAYVTTSETFGFSIKENDHLKYEVLPNNNSIVLIKYF
jgi:hypothetical protein